MLNTRGRLRVPPLPRLRALRLEEVLIRLRQSYPTSLFSALRGLPRPSLPVWQALITSVVVIGTGTVVAAVDVTRTIYAEGALVAQRVDDAVAGMLGPSVQAAALSDERLADAITDSLRNNPVVGSVRLFAVPNGSTTLLSSAGVPPQDHTGLEAYLLRRGGVPLEREISLEHDGATVGSLVVTTNTAFFLQRFNARLLSETGELFVTVVALGGVLFLVTFWTVTWPIQRLAASVAVIDPEQPGAAALPPTKRLGSEVDDLIAKFVELLRGFQAALDARRAAEHRLSVSIEGSRQVAYEVDFQHNSRWMTPNFAELLGYPPGTDVTRYSLTDIIHPDDRQRITAEQSAFAAAGHGMYEAEYRLVRPIDGGVVWVLTRGRVERDALGQAVRFVGMTADITDRKRAEMRLEEMAKTDVLTGLPNRAITVDRAEQAVRAAVNRGRSCAIIHLDLHDFHQFNATYGHDAGDQCLQHLARRLQTVVPGDATVGRVDGDEFVVIAPDLTAATADALAEQLVAAGAEPVDVGGDAVAPTLSAGVAMCPSDGRSASELLAAAQIAVVHAERAGAGRVQFYDQGLGRTAVHRRALERELQQAIGHGGLFLLYQPRFDLTSGRMVGVEALLRWRRGEAILLPPAFLSIADEAGFADQLGLWVIERAFADHSAFRAFLPDDAPFRIALNLAPQQMGNAGLLNAVRDGLERHSIPPQAIEFELTEASLSRGSPEVFRRLTELRAVGVHVALDDFGAGHTSLDLVGRTPLTSMHFERGFLQGAVGNPVRSSIVKAVVGVAQGVGLPTLVKGIETEEMVAFCRDLGITEAQGYHFAVPMPLSGVRDWFQDPTRAGRSA